MFDPLALCLILAANKQFEWALRGQGGWVHDEPEKKNILDSWSTFFKKPPLDNFDPRPETPKEPEVDLEQVNRLAAEAAEETRIDTSEGSLVVEPDDDKPYKGRGVPPAMPLTASYQQAEVPEEPNPYQDVKPDAEHWYDTVDQTEEKSDPFMEDLIMAKEPEAVAPAEPVKIDIPNPRAAEAAPGTNRGVMFTQPIQADNTPALGKAANTGFGNEFPAQPEKGDVYLRTDYLPNRLYKYNGKKWIEVDKNQTDVYAYNEMYIKYLIEQIDSGNYDIETLSDVEREQISQYLERNA